MVHYDIISGGGWQIKSGMLTSEARGDIYRNK